MELPILFQSLEQIKGKERRSKLLHHESQLYQVLHQIKKAVAGQFETGSDRMDLHIEITKDQDDAALSSKAESLQNKTVDLLLPKNWGYMGKAFVLWTPEVRDYGKTHITVIWFGDCTKPSVEALLQLVSDVLKTAIV